jgi:hypothetical protein
MRHSARPAEKASCSSTCLCLSRACLGELIVFHIQKGVFRTSGGVALPFVRAKAGVFGGSTSVARPGRPLPPVVCGAAGFAASDRKTSPRIVQLQRNADVVSEFSLRLFQACLGKMIVLHHHQKKNAFAQLSLKAPCETVEAEVSYEKAALFLSFPCVLSRACLGKLII